MKLYFALLFALISLSASAQKESTSPKKWGVEINILWPIFPGDIYKAQVTRELWKKNQLIGEGYLGIHMHPTNFREDEGDFGNFAFTFGYRQFLWKGLHLEVYQAFGPGWNRNNVIDGKDYNSWD